MSALADLPLIASGKVREIYDLGDSLLMVASDRISTYDVVHPTPIPDKGSVLTGLSTFWFELTGAIVPNHCCRSTDGVPAEARGRAMRAQAPEMLPVECVVRGYLSGSGWKDYQATGAVCGIALPDGPARVRPAARADLHADAPRPTSATTRRSTSTARSALVGDRALAERLRDVSIAVYTRAAEHARERGIILADTKFEFGLDADGDADARRRGAARPTPRASGRPTSYEPGRAQPSFDKQFVRDWASGTGWDRTAAGAGDPRRRRRAHAGASTSRPTSGSPASRSTLAARRTPTALMRGARVLVRPKAGILDPQGQAVERALPALGFPACSNVHVGRLIELDVEDPAQLPEMCERLLANPLIEDYEIRRDTPAVKFGVIRFPGSCDDVDALLAAARVGEAVLLWHADRDLQGVDAVVVPGGFSYGDYLRAGAIARFAPVMEEVAEFARDGGLVLGICNGFQVCARRACSRARCCPTSPCASSAARSSSSSPVATARSRARVPRASGCRSRSSTRPAATTRPEAELDRSRPPARSCCATRPARTPTARCRTSPAWATSRATCSA